ncbi:hypothetical protein HHL21_06055 [Massilia sp. RP-1-19]|uniref:Uncharacterized protein n=1 Tax=Massilia polaris TaxID=2728846 RepID=A0A848HHX3_9BURK|nr:AAA-like domain-containing protein [Massilia polaris]NML60657.1 hypothetical protein [Massilia polaris]
MSVTNGPVPLHCKEYIERKFERDVRATVIKRDWVLLLGPRQHGKTSALIRIREFLIESGFRCGLADLQRMPPGLNFKQMLEWFATTVAQSMKIEVAPQLDSNELVDWLASMIAMPGAPVVILIDEASSIRDEAQRNAFFGQIRAIKGAAAAAEPESLLANVQFVFAGTFRPETLVDDLNSPFNVCVRIDTDDLDLAQVIKLTSVILSRAEAEVKDIAELIYSAVGGQPHLVQSLVSIAEDELPENRLESIKSQIAVLSSEGSEHIRSLFRTVVQDSNLEKIAATAASHGSIINDPANIDYKFMTTIGLLRRENANLVFRNALYESIARSSTQLRPDVPEEDATHVFLLPLDEAQFDFIADVELREICASSYNGAVSASNSRYFRLAIIGYGVALEAILMDWLIQKGTPAITAAISAVPAAQRPQFLGKERVANPLTWRLVNLMLVGRFLHGVRGPVDLPTSLREFRNWVHPAVIKKAYHPEAAVAPEARLCNALLSIIIRDIQA